MKQITSVFFIDYMIMHSLFHCTCKIWIFFHHTWNSHKHDPCYLGKKNGGGTTEIIKLALDAKNKILTWVKVTNKIKTVVWKIPQEYYKFCKASHQKASTLKVKGCNSKLLLKCVIGIKSFSAIIYEEKVLSTLIFTFGT